MSRRQDLKDLKFGHLYVKDFSHRKGKHLYWVCVCDCGKITYQCTTNLKRGNVISCGCIRNKKSGERLKGNIPKIKFEKGVASFNVLYKQYEGGAKRRNIGWSLTKDEFRELTSKDCYYCSSEPKTTISRRGTNGEYTYNGVDRKNSKESYNWNNCVPCCSICNFLKMDLDYLLFLNQIRKIYENTFQWDIS